MLLYRKKTKGLQDKAEVEKDSEFGSGKGRKAPPTPNHHLDFPS
jgi:hypothetical protein